MQKKTYDAAFKARVDLEALKGMKTINEVATDYRVHPNVITKWCASRLIEESADLYTIKELLGHSSIKTTERYTHLAHSKLRQAVEKLNGKVE